MKKRLLSLALAICMVFTLLPVYAFAADVVDSGYCGAEGDNLIWTLDSRGTLTVSGIGAMNYFTHSDSNNYGRVMTDAPWDNYRESIKSVVINSGVSSIGRYAFYGCSNLTDVTIGTSVTVIHDNAFCKCTGLIHVVIPDSVNSIGEEAFSQCSSLSNISIGNSVTAIGKDAFYETDYYNDLSNWKNEILYIGNCLIKAKTSITTADIRAGTKTIADRAFCGCNSLASVSIPNSINSIGDYAFESCTCLTSITVPDSVTNIGYCAFPKCYSLKEINVSGTNRYYSSSDGVLFNKDKTELIFCVSTKNGDYSIPSSVTSISDNAFEDCFFLTGITIPDSVTNIGYGAFCGCDGIAKMVIPHGVTSIEGALFYACESLTSVTIPNGVTSIGNQAFQYCDRLESITIPKSVTSIDADAFADTAIYNNEGNWKDGILYIGDCLIKARNDIQTADISADTRIIANDAFLNCSKLRRVTISDSVTNIGELAFCGCSSLKSITIPDGVTSICWQTFDKCRGLTHVVIPSSVTSIDVYAFNECDSLADVYYGGNEDQWNAISIEDWNDDLLNANIHYNGEGIADSFNEYTYRADRMTNPDSIEAKSYNTLLADMPCEIMARALEESGFRSSAEAWKALTTTVESIDDPSNLWESGLEEKDMFSAIILKALQSSTEFEIPRMILKTETDAKEYWGIFANTIKTEFNISSLDNLKLDDLTAKQLNELNDQVKENLKKNAPEFSDTDKFFSLMDDIADGATLLTDYCEKIAAYFNLLQLENSMKEVVREMYEVACENNADLPLRLALKDCVDVLNTGENALTFDIMMNVGVNGVLRYTMKELTGALWDSVMDSVKVAHPAVAAIYAAYHAGKFVCNQLLSTDDLVENYFKMFATMECEQLAAVTVGNLRSDYLSKNTVDNAKAYLDSVKLSFGFAYEDCDAAYAFCDTSDKAVFNQILQAFGKADYSEVKSEIDTLKSVLKDHQTLTETAWVYSLDDDFPESGLFEKYRTRTDDILSSMREKYHIACPVNVYVYDNENNLVAYIEDGNVYAEGNVVAVLKGDEKTISIYDDADCRIVCEGYDNGTMNIIAEEYDGDEVSRILNFNDVPVSSGTAFSTETGSGVITNGSETIQPDYDSASTNSKTVDGKIEGGYFESKEGIFVNSSFNTGNVITVTAIAPKGMKFDHWVCSDDGMLDDINSVSTALTVPNENFDISAVFKLSNPFVDVQEGSVYYDAILWAYYHEPQQITGGFTATEFRPGNPCTRAQVVTFLWRAEGCPEPTGDTSIFKDAASIATPFQKAVAWAVERGITAGFNDGTFRPNDPVTRAQFVTFLWRYEGQPETTGSINGFKDAASIATPYQQAVAWAVEKGITTGYEDNTFRPNAACTRWAVVLFMYRDLA